MLCSFVAAFRKGKKQLSPIETEQTRRLANVRMHVECVIGLLRQKFNSFDDTLSLVTVKQQQDGYQLIDKIVVLCCCLTNLMPSIVPLV